MKIVLASHNKNKLQELRFLIKNMPIEVLSSQDFSLVEPEESGNSFAENALIKAQYTAQQTGLIALSDDSGLEVYSLNNQPGIFSARWAVDSNYDVAIARIKKELDLKYKDINFDTKARFVCVLCIYFPNDILSLGIKKGHYSFLQGEVEGILVFPPRGNNGFAYDTIFQPQGFDKTFAEMSFIEKNSLGHRYLAFQKLKEYLLQYV